MNFLTTVIAARRQATALFVGLVWSLTTTWTVLADGFPTPALADVDPAGIDGALVICGGGEVPQAALDRFHQLAGGEDARLVVVPTASGRADDGDTESHTALWQERGFESVHVLHTRDRDVADTPGFLAPLRTATAVWFVGGQQSRLADAYVGTDVEQELSALLRRGGVIGGTSAGAAIQSRLMIARGNPQAVLMQGLDLLPWTIIDQHFKVRHREPRLTAVLKDHPGYVGFGIDEDTAMLVEGRRIRVVGKSSVTVCLSKSQNRSQERYEVSAGRSADLTALRRAAVARAQAAFPPKQTALPVVEAGSLMIVGGGRLPQSMWERFVELAGGEQARIVVVPTASERPTLEDRSDVRALQEAGASSVVTLHTTDRTESESDDFVSPLREATGVWFGGGRQWRLVDAYGGTATERAFHDVLKRGGVVGGSSAGATIQGEYLVRGNPLGNREMMAEGYERGFGFLPGVAIDQHFTQRNRLPDMESLKRTFPQLLGIGIDESTALVVQENFGTVIGKSDVLFYDAPAADAESQPPFTRVSSGDTYDLRTRRASD